MSLPPLESGPYIISSVNFQTGEPVTRYLGAINDNIAVLPLGSSPSIWNIVQLSGNIYALFFGGRIATVVNGSLKLANTGAPPFEWLILRGAPSPPPIGVDNFGIIVPNHQPQESWFIGNTGGNQAVAVPVTIGNSASSIVIKSVLRE